MTQECVVDAELFKKYCLDSGRCNSCQERSQCESSYYEVANCLVVKGKLKFVIQEWGCLDDFLKYVENGKCPVYYNDIIKIQYINLFDKMPLDLMNSIHYLLSKEGLTVKKDRGELNGEDLNLIDSVGTLKPKKDYLDIVTCLKTRIIVSTQEDKKNVYTAKLLGSMSLVPICRNVCEQRDEIFKEIK